ncbi:MAG: SDR family oxidoreductase [Bryobacterales bacterium]
MVLLVTGGGRGIGAATARLAAAKGWSVCVNYLHDQRSAEAVVADAINLGVHAVAFRADVAVERDVTDMFKAVDQELGPITGLVNNAATLEPQMRLESMVGARLQRMFATNAIGPMLCAREAVARMSTKQGGTGGAIVNVSSLAAKSGSPNEYLDYAATKGAIETFTVGLSREVALEGIRVNAVRPGFIYTGLHAKGGEPNRVDRVMELTPMKRGGQPAEVAAAILWLLSDEASYVSGATLDVAGGL